MYSGLSPVVYNVAITELTQLERTQRRQRGKPYMKLIDLMELSLNFLLLLLSPRCFRWSKLTEFLVCKVIIMKQMVCT